MSERKSLLEILPASQVFILGIIASFFVITSIGFFVLLFKFVI